MKIPITDQLLAKKDEWNFSTKDKGEWEPTEWNACYHYEFMRESALSENWRERLRQALITPGRKGYSNTWQPEFYEIWPEWPKHPFLSIDTKERRKRIQKGHVFDSANLQRDLNYIIGRYKDQVTIPSCKQSFVQGDYDGPLWNGRKTIVTGPGKEIVCFEIDWSLGKIKTLRDLKNWLYEHDPEKLPLLKKAPGLVKGTPVTRRVKLWPKRTLLGLKPHERRGGASATRRFQAELKSLGVLRIWCFVKTLAHNQAWAKIASDIDWYEEQLGKQFVYQEAWVRARHRAEELASQF